MRIKPTCPRPCPNRRPTCHKDCEAYQAFRRARDKENADIKAYKMEYDGEAVDFRKHSIAKTIRAHGSQNRRAHKEWD